MADIWLISDTHFRHEAMLGFTDHYGNYTRPGFANVNEVDELMFDNWNSVVKPNDTVWHLGDVLFGENKDDWLDQNFHKLNGKKNLVVGNHDNIKLLSRYFNKVQLQYQNDDFDFLCTHIPLHVSQTKRPRPGVRTAWKDMPSFTNVHGHIHSNPTPDGPYKCVCVEKINYTPVHIEELANA